MAPQKGIIFLENQNLHCAISTRTVRTTQEAHAQYALCSKHTHSTHYAGSTRTVGTLPPVLLWTKHSWCIVFTGLQASDWNNALGLTAWTDRASRHVPWHSQSPGGKAAEAWSSLASSAASYEYRQSYLNSPIRLHFVLLNSAPKIGRF
jgi:hypothetical protein